MIKTRTFVEHDVLITECRDKVMMELNAFIEVHNIKASDILEFKTHRKFGFFGSRSFEVTISWWE